MISEQQARTLLEHCEDRLGKDSLVSLRLSLLGNKPKESLWELLVLYACLDAAPIVQHEPKVGMPDVLLFDESGAHILSVEATFIHSRSTKKSEIISEFRRYVYKDVTKHVPSIKGLRIDLENLSDRRKDVCLPPSHTWKSLLASLGRHSRYSDLRKGQGQVIEFPEINLLVTMSPDDREGPSGGNKVPGLPQELTGHPCYKILKSKGGQAKNWQPSIKEAPILVIIGVDGVSGEFDVDGQGVIGLRQAVLGALLDTTKLPPLVRMNLLNDWRPKALRLNVDGSKLISGVAVINLYSQSALGSGSKYPKISYFKNEDADSPITGEVSKIVAEINFNKISYGPGWESWSQNDRAGHIERYKREGGSMSVRDSRECMVFEIPSIVLLRVLSGEVSIDDVYSPYGGQGSFEGMIKKMLSEGREILDITLKEGDKLKREEDKAVITIGPKVAKVISVAKTQR